MGKKSKKQMAKAEAMMAEALRIKAEALKLVGGNAENTTPQHIITDTHMPFSIKEPSTFSSHGETFTARPASKRNIGLKVMIGFGVAIALLCLYQLYAYYSGEPVIGNTEPREVHAIKPDVINTSTGAGPAVVDTWEMPKELKEISSIAFIDGDRIACVQDQKAIIYIYNLKQKKVEKELKFGDKGDFEGVVVVGSAFYVLRADGFIIEVSAGGKAVKEYDLPLGIENETEAMFYEQDKNRILVGVKEKDPTNADGKRVYSFDLATKKMTLTPVVMLMATDDNTGAADEASGKKAKKGKKSKGNSSFHPSEIAVHPTTGEIYALNGPKSEFMVFSKDGKMTKKYQLDKEVFPQPEGMTFSPSGELYISSEAGKKGAGVIAKVTF